MRECTVCPSSNTELERCAHFGARIIHLRRLGRGGVVCGPGEEVEWMHFGSTRFDTFKEAEAEFYKLEAMLVEGAADAKGQ